MTSIHPGGPKTVLLVDNDWENRSFLRQELDSNGFIVSEADDDVMALEVLKDNPADIVIIDLELSRKQRKDLVAQLHSTRYGHPLVVMLSGPSAMSREEAYDLGASAMLSKPIEPSFLISRLNDLLVPPSTRWKSEPSSKTKPSKQVALSVDSLRLGRGGFSFTPASDSNVIEGQSVEFKVEINELSKWTLNGTGVVRYVKFDKSRRQQAWGIEFETLDEESLARVMAQNPLSYIPGALSS